MTTRLVLALRLELRSPFLFPAAGIARLGLDAVALRDARGRPIIPADQLRGVLREALSDLAAIAPGVIRPVTVGDLFGRAPADARADGADPGAAAYTPQRGNLLCTDLTAEGAPLAPARAVRVAIAPETGAALDGQLQMVELAAPPGATVAFAGTLVLSVPTGQEGAILNALRRALPLIGAIGAQKSVGFGTVLPGSATLVETARTAMSLPAATAGAPAPMPLRLRLDRAFLVDATRVADNLYVGADTIPGSVVKGALARRLEHAGLPADGGRFASLLAATRVSHAVPEDATGKPAGGPLPLSLLARKTIQGELLVGDSLGAPPGHGVLLHAGKADPGLAGWHASDWKDGWEVQVRTRLGIAPRPEPARDLRVHTAIHPETGIADDGRLFATAALAHRHADPATGLATGPERSWRLRVDPPPTADPAAWAVLRALLLAGLDGIGRTGARGSFDPGESEAADPPHPYAPDIDGFALMLTTPAVLIDPHPSLDARAAYDAYFAAILPKARLVDFVARQRLAGGYLAQRHRAYGDRYVPFVVTEPGSVFLLEGATAAELQVWIKSGLPVPKLGGQDATWRSCPFMPENGYGAFCCVTRHAGLDRMTYV